MASENTNTNSPQSASGPTNNTTVTIENQTSTNVENGNNNTSAATLGPEEEASKSQVRMPIILMSSDQLKQCFTVLPEQNRSIKISFPEPKPNGTEHVKSA